jgi:hypothetical protein
MLYQIWHNSFLNDLLSFKFNSKIQYSGSIAEGSTRLLWSKRRCQVIYSRYKQNGANFEKYVNPLD